MSVFFDKITVLLPKMYLGHMNKTYTIKNNPVLAEVGTIRKLKVN